MNPRFLNYPATYDVASDVCQALDAGAGAVGAAVDDECPEQAKALGIIFSCGSWSVQACRMVTGGAARGLLSLSAHSVLVHTRRILSLTRQVDP